MAASDQTLLRISCGRPEDVAGKIILFQAGIYLFKVNNRHTKLKLRLIKLTRKTLELRHGQILSTFLQLTSLTV